MPKWALSLCLLLLACGGSAPPASSGSYNYSSPPSYHGGGGGGGGDSPMAEMDVAPAPVVASESTQRVAAKSHDEESAPKGPPPPPPPGTVPQQAQAAQRQQQQDNKADPQPHAAAMLIYTANLTMAVYQVEPGLNAIEKIAKDVGGYLAVRSDTAITIRVPRERFEDALKQVEKTGDVVHRDVQAEDVTDQFVDLDARLRNAQAMRDRLQELLKKATTKEALEIEIQLERVMGEIEAMQGKLKLLKDKIAFSMITVTFAARGEAAVRDMPLRLPFPWLNSLGLPRLLSL